MDITSKWQERDIDQEILRDLVAGNSRSNALCRVLAGRGITAESVAGYLAPQLSDLPDPFRLAGMKEAVARLQSAVLRGEKIGVFGDYDVDGVTSTTVLWDVLEALGVTVCATLPDRLKEGYGLSKAGVDRLAKDGAKVIVTVDCGVTAVAEVEYAISKGLEVIIVDHHTVPVEMPQAVAIINPHRDDCIAKAENLCAVGVVFNLCAALRKSLRDSGFFSEQRVEPDLREVLDLVALGTVADVVPLKKDNRIFVTYGLKVADRGARLGMRALIDISNIRSPKLMGGHLGFQLGPRINAAGRLGDAMKAVQLFRSEAWEEAQMIAHELDQENLLRRDVEKRILLAACTQVDASPELTASKILVLYDENWHPGVVGIVASRLVEHYGRPAIVIGENGRGSGRSIPAYHLYDAIFQNQEHLDGFGGHAHAAGLKLKVDELSTFREKMVQHAAENLSDSDLGQVLRYDGELELPEIDEELCIELEKASPYGRGNPEPVFRFNNLKVFDLKELKGGHFKCVLQRSPKIEAIVFGKADRISEFKDGVDLLAVVERSFWRDRVTLQLRVKDFC